MTLKFRSLSVQGFRAYGAEEQTLLIPGDITAVWGPNSKGKTSLGEAFEFLMTGRIARRELMASSQDEFADALRNAHLADATPVQISAKVICADGVERTIQRILVRDFSKREDCVTGLSIDGIEADEADLATHGLILSQPPLCAPVLAQHTLAHIFTVKPQDRSNYFKALLEVTDLDAIRAEIVSLEPDVAPPLDPWGERYDTCRDQASLSTTLPKSPEIVDLATFNSHLVTALGAALGEFGVERADGEEESDALRRALEDRRSRMFPVALLAQPPMPTPIVADPAIWDDLIHHADEMAKVAEETRKLASLFTELLELPDLDDCAPLDCPVCETPNALSAARLGVIRRHVAQVSDFSVARKSAETALGKLGAYLEQCDRLVTAATPSFISAGPAKRRAKSFALVGMRAVLVDEPDGEPLISSWLRTLPPLLRQRSACKAAITAAREERTSSMDTLDRAAIARLRVAIARCSTRVEGLAVSQSEHAEALAPLRGRVSAALDVLANTTAFAGLLEIAENPKACHEALRDRAALALVAEELRVALRQFDAARETVMEDKFALHSGAVARWWELLRPGEPTFFSAVKQRKGAKRTIDFKAGLVLGDDRATAKLRDVIAVFSQSQLHCLGLALFLARAEREGASVIVLDDPVMASDEDYRAHFNSGVIEALLAADIQTIVLTQDHRSWDDLELLHRHRGIARAQLLVDTIANGAIIENTSDTLKAKLNRASSLARGGHPAVLKECGVHLRDAGERFCKELLVRDRLAKGDSVSLADYDGKTLEWLAPRIEVLLARDPSHPGKFAVFRNTVNDACHDNAPPGSVTMVQAVGELRALAKDYLDR